MWARSGASRAPRRWWWCGTTARPPTTAAPGPMTCASWTARPRVRAAPGARGLRVEQGRRGVGRGASCGLGEAPRSNASLAAPGRRERVGKEPEGILDSLPGKHKLTEKRLPSLPSAQSPREMMAAPVQGCFQAWKAQSTGKTTDPSPLPGKGSGEACPISH